MRGSSLVREARERAGLTQAELASRAGTTQSSIARLENGAEPSLARLDALLGACGLELQVRLVRVGDGHVPTESPESQPELPGRGPAALARDGVPFVLAGRVAAAMYGVPVEVAAPLVVPDLAADALDRLAGSLDVLHARRRVDDGGTTLPFDRSAPGLRRGRRWAVETTEGPLDIDFEPRGTRGYVDLVRRAVDLAGVLVASPADAARQLDAAGDDLDVVTRLRDLADRTNR